jgi:pimeloyl-ACP methyl ester carboxylesterase
MGVHMKYRVIYVFFITWLMQLTSYPLIANEYLNQHIEADSCGYAEINEVRLYFELHGAGEFLLYLHGGLGSSKDFEKYIPELSKYFTLITVDRRGHGRSFDNGEPYSYASMADDINQFLEYLGVDSAFVIGWSDGGVVGFHLASQYSNRVRKLIAVGANYRVEGLTQASLEWINNQLTVENMSKYYPQFKKDYETLNPQPDNFDNFIRQTKKMWLHNPYISKEDFIRIDKPVLLVVGDNDDVRLDHVIEMHSLLNESQLCILPNTTHFVFDEYNDIIMQIILKFLKNMKDYKF